MGVGIETVSYFILASLWAVALVVARRHGSFSPLSFYALFLSVDYSVYCYLAFSNLEGVALLFTAMPVSGLDLASKAVATYSFLAASIILLTTLTLPATGARRFLVFVLIKDASKNQRFKLWSSIFLGCALLAYGYHFLSIDKSLLWKNDEYLLLAQPDRVGIKSELGRIAHFLLLPTGLITVSLVQIFVSTRRSSLAIVSAILGASYPLIYAVALNSRWAVVYMAALIFCALVYTNLFKRVMLSVSYSCIAMLLFLKVMLGRSSEKQGLVAIFDYEGYFSGGLFEIRFIILGGLLNVFQSLQNFANSGLMNPEFGVAYKVLSFLPSFSFMDSFSVVRDASMQKITPYVPMNAYSEAFHFGFPYYVILGLAVVIWLRTSTRLYQTGTAAGVFVAILSYWVTFMLSQYPVRNSIRVVYLLVFIALFILPRAKKSNLSVSNRSEGK